MRIVYFGSSDFSCVILSALCMHGYKPVLVVSQPDKPKGRGLKIVPTEVSSFSLQHALKLLTPQSLREGAFFEQLKEAAADLLIVADYGKLLPRDVLTLAGIMPIAVHPSLLPCYRGSAPINWALINGDSVTGVTIFKMNEAMDSGDVLLQKIVPIKEEDNAVTLHASLAHESAVCLIESLEIIKQNKAKLLPQDTTKVTIARKLTKDDGKIIWNERASAIGNLIRGLAGWPTAYTYFQNKKIKILEAEALSEQVTCAAGSIERIDKKGIYVSTAQGLLRIKKLIPEGKKSMDAWSFVVGHHVKVGDKFE